MSGWLRGHSHWCGTGITTANLQNWAGAGNPFFNVANFNDLPAIIGAILEASLCV
jgi:hypothetical protein